MKRTIICAFGLFLGIHASQKLTNLPPELLAFDQFYKKLDKVAWCDQTAPFENLKNNVRAFNFSDRAHLEAIMYLLAIDFEEYQRYINFKSLQNQEQP